MANNADSTSNRPAQKWVARNERFSGIGEGTEFMGRPNKMLAALIARVRLDEREDPLEPEPLTPDEELEARRSELRNGLTDLQRLFLFGKLSGLNDKDAAIAAGYSPSGACGV